MLLPAMMIVTARIINKYLNATLNTTLKYDNDVKTINDEGEKRGAKVQFKDILGIGVAYNF